MYDATRFEWKTHILQKYAADDSSTNAAAIEEIASDDTPIGRLVDGVLILWYVLLLIPLLLVLLFLFSFFSQFLSSELRLMTSSTERCDVRYFEEPILSFKTDFESLDLCHKAAYVILKYRNVHE